MDFEKLIKYLRERYGAKKVFYYAGLDPEKMRQSLRTSLPLGIMALY